MSDASTLSFPWLDTEAYPFTNRYFEVGMHKMHYIDEGQGKESVLFVHGTPSWSFDFRHLIKGLMPGHRCVAADHIGFGLSDKPADYDYSIRHHCETLEAFITHHIKEPFHLVVHDFGGPIGFQYALRHPEQIKSLVILNSWMWSSQQDPEFIKMRRILRSPLLPFLYLYLNFSPAFVMPRSFGNKKISRQTLKQYTRPFAKKSERYGALAFARSLLQDQDWFESLYNQRALIAHLPALLIWGMKDPVILPHHLRKFEETFLHSKSFAMGTCGHFPQEEEHERTLEALLQWLEEYRT